jgi:DNA-binding HxlR family transcriptional regulator
MFNLLSLRLFGPEIQRTPRLVRWALTDKGKKDMLPILMAFIAFGSSWYADVVFEEK